MPNPRHPLSNLWRLRQYLRPYAWQYVRLILAGCGSTGVAIVIPVLVQDVIDGPVAHHQPGGLWSLGALAFAFGIAEAGLIFYRRWANSTSALGLETVLRNDIYAHLQGCR